MRACRTNASTAPLHVWAIDIHQGSDWRRLVPASVSSVSIQSLFKKVSRWN